MVFFKNLINIAKYSTGTKNTFVACLFIFFANLFVLSSLFLISYIVISIGVLNVLIFSAVFIGCKIATHIICKLINNYKTKK